jgi:hypothetical protein
LGIPWFEAGARGDQKFRFPPRPPRREPSRSVFLLPAPPTEVASDSPGFLLSTRTRPSALRGTANRIVSNRKHALPGVGGFPFQSDIKHTKDRLLLCTRHHLSTNYFPHVKRTVQQKQCKLPLYETHFLQPNQSPNLNKVTHKGGYIHMGPIPTRIFFFLVFFSYQKLLVL